MRDISDRFTDVRLIFGRTRHWPKAVVTVLLQAKWNVMPFMCLFHIWIRFYFDTSVSVIFHRNLCRRNRNTRRGLLWGYPNTTGLMRNCSFSFFPLLISRFVCIRISFITCNHESGIIMRIFPINEYNHRKLCELTANIELLFSLKIII